MQRQTALRLTTTALILILGSALPGCYYPGGPMVSVDRFTYESTSWQPWTVTLVDTRTGQSIWTQDVPVGKQLVISFRPGQGTDDDFTPDSMQWQIFPIGTRFGGLTNKIPVPAASARRVDAKLRKTPELPEEMLNPQRPGEAPVKDFNRDDSSFPPPL